MAILQSKTNKSDPDGNPARAAQGRPMAKASPSVDELLAKIRSARGASSAGKSTLTLKVSDKAENERKLTQSPRTSSERWTQGIFVIIGSNLGRRLRLFRLRSIADHRQVLFFLVSILRNIPAPRQVP